MPPVRSRPSCTTASSRPRCRNPPRLASGRVAPADGRWVLTTSAFSVEALLRDADLSLADQLPEVLARHAAGIGLADALAYLVDLQQTVLVPMLGPTGATPDHQIEVLPVDSTLAGRCYQHSEVLAQQLPGGGRRLWVPLLHGAERLGVLAVTPGPAEELPAEMSVFAAVTAGLLATKTFHGDAIVRLRRRIDMGLAAEMQWSLLPPLTFGSADLGIAAALEPAYTVAGDSIDYAVDAGRASFAVFDAMGHGLDSARLACIAVAAYRNARRARQTLSETTATIDSAIGGVYGGEAFTTAILVELDTRTGALRWVNAGHPSPLLLRDRHSVMTLEALPAVPLGLGPFVGDGRYTVGRQQLEPGDRILLYTDGVVEARSPEGVFYGAERLTDVVTSHLGSGLTGAETMRRVVRALLAHQQDQLRDDASLLLAHWRPDGQITRS